MSYSRNPAFYIQLYHDAELAEHALKHVRRSYPDARVLLQSDGDDDPLYIDLTLRFRCSYFSGKRLYGRENGGKMLQRMLNDYLYGPGDCLVKIDTDTRVDRPFRNLPSERAIYGHLLTKGAPQGGCVIVPRHVATEIRDSRVLLDGRLQNARESWGSFMPMAFLSEQLDMTKRIGFEWVLFWACSELNIPTLSHPEIYATWKQGHLNSNRHFAVVHPDKFLHVRDNALHDQCTRYHARATGLYLQAIYHSAPA